MAWFDPFSKNLFDIETSPVNVWNPLLYPEQSRQSESQPKRFIAKNKFPKNKSVLKQLWWSFKKSL